jgi:hypothetical protein
MLDGYNESVELVAKFIRKIAAQGEPGAVIHQNAKWTALECFDIEHLAVTVVATGWARNVRRHLAAALRAALEDRCTPTLCATAHFLTAFGLAALWYGHGLVFVKVGP